MARPNPNDSEEVKIEKLRLDLEKYRIQEAHKTWRYLGLGFLATVAIGIIAWAMVRMTDRPAWLELGLAVLSLLGGQTILLVQSHRRLGRSMDQRFAGRPIAESGRSEGQP